MAKKSAALLGPGEGPKIQVGSHGTLSVRGLLEGEFAMLVMYPFNNLNEDLCVGVYSNGEVKFDNCRFARVSYSGKNKNFIASVLIGD